MALLNQKQHIEKVYSAVAHTNGAVTASVDAPVLCSWQRSMNQHGIDPADAARVRILTEREFKEQAEAVDDFLRIARPAVRELFRQVSPHGYCALLCDHNVTTLDWLGDDQQAREWKKAGLYLCSIWAEEEEGTCAVGTCLVEKRAITIHKGEHFRVVNADLTCSAAPILDPFGEMLGLIDISALRSPDSKESQYFALQLVKQTAQLIEAAYFYHQFEDQWLLCICNNREMAAVNKTCLLALDGNGTVLAADQTARQQFGGGIYKTMIGRDIGDIFDIKFDQFIDVAGKSNMTWPIRTITNGDYYFATLRSPQAIGIKSIQNRPAPKAKATPLKELSVAEPLSLDLLAGADRRLREIVTRAKRVLDKNIPILLNGETGTGKEVFARAIHNASSRANKPFVAINCASIPESLIESELFGYTAGAFTGALNKGMQGKIVQSNGGTLFLDEIGDMPTSLQPRLLRVLAEKEITPLGGASPIPVRLNVICATHRNIRDMVAEGSFREDLFYRLKGISFVLPPLRQRTDLAQLIRLALAIEANTEIGAIAIDEEALNLLTRYDWPGNIRQLRNVLRYALAMSDGDGIISTSLPEEVTDPELTALLPPMETSAPEKMQSAAQEEHSWSPMEQAEIALILDALKKHQWQVIKAAKEIGIGRSTMYRKMEKYDIVPPNKRP
ncbi:sigma-54-dependent transcriptional regulator, AcoR family [Syntrophotalea carbinolica DSM 2380]|uniref:Sigma-54-dependent transcriptional regulator, AcoR family n=1 Tax=Syntrophotalea carbinolica (strain DSM 2380 / NBRC 103641 / GraBd1) TaxID=338963 RepID=Q3A651_SYNC1|nr:sigma-54-dependent Fis family transcriptional regulator [Syntrophotalea carbinolica]ABA88156.1 sigma-54-dependent transcriptional regulator, AcoR family [Syntrophotalea carbinolica DSM 2380]